MYSLVASRSVLQRGARAAATSSVRYNSTRLYSSTMHENDAEVLEKEKRRNLSNTQHKTSTPHAHAPGWNENLASASEAAVKADKSASTKEDMQSQTVKYVKAQHSEENGNGTEESTTAYYQRDEVSGPLSGAKGKEEVLVHQGKVVEDEMVNDPLAEKLKKMKPTPSEADVKADRGEV